MTPLRIIVMRETTPLKELSSSAKPPSRKVES